MIPMPDCPSICVFCGSFSGVSSAYAESARLVGEMLVRYGLGLVYGDGRVSLMGIVADAILEAGGRAIGVIPEVLAMDGTCTGEHGVGRHKIAMLDESFRDLGVDLMRRLKAVWNPLNSLYSGRIVATT